MKKLIALVVLALATSAPLFGVEHVLSHSTKVAADDSYKAAKFSTKAADRAGKDSSKAVKVAAKKTGRAGKDSSKAVKVAAKKTGRAGKTFVTLLF